MIRLYCSYGFLLLALAVASPAAFGQDAAQNPESESQPFMRRFSIGGRVTVAGTPLMNSAELLRSTSDPAVSTTITTGSASKRVGGGITLEFAATDRLSIGADFLYRRAGYNRDLTRVTGVDDSSTTAVESSTSYEHETTRADYWDLPLLARYYHKDRGAEGARLFALGGATVRHVSAIRTLREVVRPDSLSDTYDAAVQPAAVNVPGLILGAGVELADDIGFRFVPEVRFTRWFRPTFDNAPTVSPRNQVEVVIGFTF